MAYCEYPDMVSGPSSVSHTSLIVHPTIYAGRFYGEVEAYRAKGYLPETCRVVSEWEMRAHEIRDLVHEARALVVVDPLSLPWEMLPEEGWEIPMAVLLDLGIESTALKTVLGPALFEHLGFFDYLMTRDTALWQSLRKEYGWSEGQLISPESSRPEQVAAEAAYLLNGEQPEQTFFGGDTYEAQRYWSERGAALANSMQHRAICSVHHDLRFNKAMHRLQSSVLGEQFDRAQSARNTDIPFDVLEVGMGVGRWAQSFRNYNARFTGVDISEGMVRAARSNFPEHRFERLGEDLALPYEDESFDMVFSVSVMHHNPAEDRRKLVAEMWRVAKPGGKLVFLEDFVTGKQTEKSTVYPMPISEFTTLLRESTFGEVVLDHVESLRYPHDHMHRSAVLALSKIGVPRTW